MNTMSNTKKGIKKQPQTFKKVAVLYEVHRSKQSFLQARTKEQARRRDTERTH